MNNNNLNIENDIFLAQWLAGDITDVELKEVVSESDYLSYKKIKQTLNLAKDLKPKSDSFNKIQQKIVIKNKIKVRKLYTKWLTTAAAMVIFFVGFYHFLGSNLVTDKSSFGEQKVVALLDESQVVLNANSELSYDKSNWKNKREVTLNGEAFFKVKKGSQFTVKTKNGTITVLGTQFKVNTNDDYFEVVCYEGSVKVVTKDLTYVLKPNDAFRKINGDKIEKWHPNLSKPTWINGESTFKSVPLKYVILKFENQYNVKFDTNNIDTTVIFTGSFGHRDINIALESVFGASNIKYKKEVSKKIILSKN
jgi:ferric-dicitrate binding protein FerR (iron transport regulator)